MTLPGSGNLLAHATINAEFHEQLEILIENTKIRARATNKQVLEIQGVSKGIYLRFPNVAQTFFVKQLVVGNLSCNLNLGAQFNFKTGLIPQRIIQGDNGKKTNFIELDGIQIRFQFQEVSNETLRRTVGDLEFLLIEERTTTTASWGGSGNALHLAPNKFGPTRKSLKEKI